MRSAATSAGKSEVLQQGPPESVAIKRWRRCVDFLHPLAVGLLPLLRRLPQYGQLLLARLAVREFFDLRQPKPLFTGGDEIDLAPELGVIRRSGQTKNVIAELIQFAKQLFEVQRILWSVWRHARLRRLA